MFPNDDQEMNRIYQESLHPKDYSQDGAYSNMNEKRVRLKMHLNKMCMGM